MKIALFTDGLFPEYVGGMQKHSLLLLLNLAKEGVDIDVYHPGNKVPELVQNLDFELRKRINLIHVPFPDSVRFPGHYLWNSYRYSRNVLKAYKQRNNDVDFVYAQGFSGWAYIKNKSVSMPPIGSNFQGL